MWALTQSPYALLFAVLGPLVAVGGLLDARRRRRRTIAANLARHESELSEARARVDAAHSAERRELLRSVRSSLDILTHGRPTHERWRHGTAASLPVSIGTGSVPSGIQVDGPSAHELVAHAATLTGAPVVCDARNGIGIIGATPAAHSLLRALTVQLAHAVSPALAQLRLHTAQDAPVDGEHEWFRSLPHSTSGPVQPVPPAGTARAELVVELVAMTGESIATVAMAHRESDVPGRCGVVIRVEGASARIVRWPSPDAHLGSVLPVLLARESAVRCAVALRRTAVDDGLLADTGIPPRVDFGELGPQPPASSGSLECIIGLGAGRAPVSLDLVGDGPHALVGGTTGSGKSELLCAWVLAMASTRTPRDLTVLLVDYKGGASFRSIERLPHVVGTITDLDPAETRRALDSLTAELRHRENELARHNARDLTELAPGILARLVIVVDEYAALVNEHPELHTIFSDIAARGRSLGMHLILSTQRPSGIVRDSILANTPLRVSLRVLEPADSTAVIGAADAARLGSDRPGRAYLVTARRPLAAVQPALVTAHDCEHIIERTDRGASPPRRPWQPPLPTRVTLGDLDAASDPTRALGFALADRPAEQRRTVAALDLTTMGNILVAGARASGRTSALAALASACRRADIAVDVIPGDIEGAWDAVHHLLDSARGVTDEPRLCLLDDLDLVLSRTPDDYRDALSRALAALLAEGPARGIHTAVSVSRVSAAVSAVAQHCDTRLVLRTADRHEHQAAGGDPASYESDVPPGRGWFQGDLVQVVSGDAAHDTLRVDATRTLPDLPRTVAAIVTTRPDDVIGRISRAWGSAAIEPLAHSATVTAGLDALVTGGVDDQPRVIVGHPDAWQSRFTQLTELGRHAPVAFHACTLAQFRQLSGSRGLPPPLAPSSADAAWLTHPSGGITRGLVPCAPDGSVAS